MAKAPGDRYQRAEEMLVDVEQVMRVAFRAVGQTELKRWLQDLSVRDGVLPLIRGLSAPPTPPGGRASGDSQPHRVAGTPPAFPPGRAPPPPPPRRTSPPTPAALRPTGGSGPTTLRPPPPPAALAVGRKSIPTPPPGALRAMSSDKPPRPGHAGVTGWSARAATETGGTQNRGRRADRRTGRTSRGNPSPRNGRAFRGRARRTIGSANESGRAGSARSGAGSSTGSRTPQTAPESDDGSSLPSGTGSNTRNSAGNNVRSSARSSARSSVRSSARRSVQGNLASSSGLGASTPAATPVVLLGRRGSACRGRAGWCPNSASARRQPATAATAPTQPGESDSHTPMCRSSHQNNHVRPERDDWQSEPPWA